LTACCLIAPHAIVGRAPVLTAVKTGPAWRPCRRLSLAVTSQLGGDGGDEGGNETPRGSHGFEFLAPEAAPPLGPAGAFRGATGGVAAGGGGGAVFAAGAGAGAGAAAAGGGLGGGGAAVAGGGDGGGFAVAPRGSHAFAVRGAPVVGVAAGGAVAPP